MRKIFCHFLLSAPLIFASVASLALTLDCRLESNLSSGFLIFWDRQEAEVQTIDEQGATKILNDSELFEFAANLFIVKTTMREGRRWGCYEIWIPVDANLAEEFPAHLFYCGNSSNPTRVKELRAHLRCQLTSYTLPEPEWVLR